MYPAKISKTTFTVTVLHDAEMDISSMDLENVLDDMNFGDLIGQVECSAVEPIESEEKVREELLNVGNDGTFFDSPFDDE